jgi:hypothetical protein
MTIIPVLNAEEEEFAFKKMRKDAQTNCKELLGALVDCTKTKTITLYWPWNACEPVRKVAFDCLNIYANLEIKEDIRKDLLNKKIEYLKQNGRLMNE